MTLSSRVIVGIGTGRLSRDNIHVNHERLDRRFHSESVWCGRTRGRAVKGWQVILLWDSVVLG